jgi:hypothetical protein
MSLRMLFIHFSLCLQAGELAAKRVKMSSQEASDI